MSASFDFAAYLRSHGWAETESDMERLLEWIDSQKITSPGDFAGAGDVRAFLHNIDLPVGAVACLQKAVDVRRMFVIGASAPVACADVFAGRDQTLDETKQACHQQPSADSDTSQEAGV